MKKSVINSITVNTTDTSAKEPVIVKVDMNSLWARRVLVPALEELKASGKDWTMIEIPLELINEFKGQRDFKHSLSYILNNFDYRRVDVKSVNFHDGYFTCWDGKHTVRALRVMGYKTAWFRMFNDLPLEEEARLFIEQSKGVTRLTPTDKFNCARQLRMEPAKSILEVCDKFNVTVCEKRKPIRNITAPRKLMQIFDEYGKDGVNFALGVIELSGWANHDSKAYVEASLNIGYQAYKMYGNDLINLVKLADALKEYKTSTEFIDKQREVFKEVSAKHPEGCMGLFVESVINAKKKNK